MRRGSITIFALLSMMLVVSVLLALLEAGRFHQIKRLAALQTQVALESVFAEYNTHLWEEYRILACNQNGVFEKLETYGNRQIVNDRMGTNFFQFRVLEADVEGYTRLTDGGGSAFIQAATGYMKKNLVYETAKNIYNQYEGIKTIEDMSDYSFIDIGKTLDYLKKEETEEIEVRNIQSQSRVTIRKCPKDILEFIQDMQKKGILSLVLQEDMLSEKAFRTKDRVSDRILPGAYNSDIVTQDWYSKVLFQQYILTYLSSFLDEREHGMSYEVEYVLTGKDSDIENLKGTINRLLAIRTAANFLYLSNDVSKQEEAGILAMGIAGASANPILIKTVKNAIITAWAFGESVLDIRTLLTGGKIALLKSNTSWTLQMDGITKLNEGYPKAKHCNDGLSYKEYLGILLLFQQDEITAMRTMDVQEETLREKYKDASICMEDWIIELKALVSYRYQPVFFSIQKNVPSWEYEIFTREQFSY